VGEGGLKPDPDRGDRMAERVFRTGEARGVLPSGLSLLAASMSLAMEPRRRLLSDDRHPDFLHPGRTALILMDDVGETDPVVLSAAVLVESVEPRLRTSAGTVRERLRGAGGGESTSLLLGREPEDSVSRLVEAVPLPDRWGERLLEALVTAPPEAQQVALAERLDHLRHAHLLEDRALRRALHTSAVKVYLPLSGRGHPALARRYRTWCNMFARRHL